MIWPCHIKSVKHQFLFSVDLTDKTEQMQVSFTIQITKQSKEVQICRLLDPSALWFSKLKMHFILLAGIIRRKICINSILLVDIGKLMKILPFDLYYHIILILEFHFNGVLGFWGEGGFSATAGAATGTARFNVNNLRRMSSSDVSAL